MLSRPDQVGQLLLCQPKEFSSPPYLPYNERSPCGPLPWYHLFPLASILKTVGLSGRYRITFSRPICYCLVMGRQNFYTITEAARKLKITRAAVYEAIHKGRLEAEEGKIVQVKVARGLRIPAKSLSAYRVSLLHQWVGKKTS